MRDQGNRARLFGQVDQAGAKSPCGIAGGVTASRNEVPVLHRGGPVRLEDFCGLGSIPVHPLAQAGVLSNAQAGPGRYGPRGLASAPQRAAEDRVHTDVLRPGGSPGCLSSTEFRRPRVTGLTFLLSVLHRIEDGHVRRVAARRDSRPLRYPRPSPHRRGTPPGASTRHPANLHGHSTGEGVRRSPAPLLRAG
jgi:hypothetical protein